MKVLGAALGDHLNLRSVVAAEFGGLPVGRDLEFGDGVHADAISELLIDADIGHVLTVEREVVLRCAAAIDADVARARVGGDAGNGLQQAGVVAAVDRDVHHLFAGDDAGAFRRSGSEVGRQLASTVTDSPVAPTCREIGRQAEPVAHVQRDARTGCIS